MIRLFAVAALALQGAGCDERINYATTVAQARAYDVLIPDAALPMNAVASNALVWSQPRGWEVPAPVPAEPFDAGVIAPQAPVVAAVAPAPVIAPKPVAIAQPVVALDAGLQVANASSVDAGAMLGSVAATTAPDASLYGGGSPGTAFGFPVTTASALYGNGSSAALRGAQPTATTGTGGSANTPAGAGGFVLPAGGMPAPVGAGGGMAGVGAGAGGGLAPTSGAGGSL